MNLKGHHQPGFQPKSQASLHAEFYRTTGLSHRASQLMVVCTIADSSQGLMLIYCAMTGLHRGLWKLAHPSSSAPNFDTIFLAPVMANLTKTPGCSLTIQNKSCHVGQFHISATPQPLPTLVNTDTSSLSSCPSQGSCECVDYDTSHEHSLCLQQSTNETTVAPFVLRGTSGGILSEEFTVGSGLGTDLLVHVSNHCIITVHQRGQRKMHNSAR